ncbi:lysM domain receptor-like kinase 4-like [Dorcoceras hygrometricum]|uniref:LysM domain receptor-like kinase 4-like n=1 Tax=Dorcoceras hygrometricum TaxID=472368 RepID=A0A2Z7AQP6_9LAMI|nr:lysM domain receptor-like kinase 4-like [Dorcoceras hygrometricum]
MEEMKAASGYTVACDWTYCCYLLVLQSQRLTQKFLQLVILASVDWLRNVLQNDDVTHASIATSSWSPSRNTILPATGPRRNAQIFASGSLHNSSHDWSSASLEKLHGAMKPFGDKTGLGYNSNEGSTVETSSNPQMVRTKRQTMNFVKPNMGQPIDAHPVKQR